MVVLYFFKRTCKKYAKNFSGICYQLDSLFDYFDWNNWVGSFAI